MPGSILPVTGLVPSKDVTVAFRSGAALAQETVRLKLCPEMPLPKLAIPILA
jgi:hypothetical protein